MSSLKSFFIRNGRLHPAWRAFLFLITFVIVVIATQVLVGISYWLIHYILQGGPIELSLEEFTQGSPLMALLMLTGFLSTFLVAYLFRRFLDGKSFRSLGFEFKRGWAWDIALGLALGGLLMGVAFVSLWIPGWLTLRGLAPLGQALPVVLWAALSLIPAAAQEELVFRGYFFRNIQEAFGTGVAVVLSAVFFGLFHGANPHITWLAFVDLVLAGVLFAVAYLVAGNLWLPIALHFAWNLFEGPVFGFPVSGIGMGGLLAISVTGPAYITGGPFGPEGGLVGGAINLTGIGILLFWRRHNVT